MLLSTGVALAQEIGCFGENETLRQTDSEESDERMRVQKEWKALLQNFIRLTDEGLALRLRVEPHFAGSGFKSIDHRSSELLSENIVKSTIDLAPHMRRARELLHSWRRNQQGIGPAVPIAAWETFKQGLDSWERDRGVGQTGGYNTFSSLTMPPPF